mgnify:CR=1 FL=1
MTAGGDAGGLIRKGEDTFQLFHRQGIEIFFAQLGQCRTEEGIACAIGIAHLAGNTRHMTGLFAKAIEHTVRAERNENQLDAVLCQLCRTAFAVSGSGEQRQFLIGNFQDVHQRKGCFHLSNGILFVLPEVGTVIRVISNDSTQLLGAGGGGDPYIGKLLAIGAVKECGEVSLIDVDELSDDDVVVPVASVGAPTILTEKGVGSNEFTKLIDMVGSYYGKKITAIMPIELAV